MTAGQNRIPVNLDYAASTPMRAEALLAQREYDDSELAGVNPNSLHSLGRKAAARLEVVRREIARSFGARVRPSEIIAPHSGIGGCAPRPRKPRPAAERMIPAMSSATRTIIDEMQSGQTWPISSRKGPAPCRRAAAM